MQLGNKDEVIISKSSTELPKKKKQKLDCNYGEIENEDYQQNCNYAEVEN